MRNNFTRLYKFIPPNPAHLLQCVLISSSAPKSLWLQHHDYHEHAAFPGRAPTYLFHPDVSDVHSCDSAPRPLPLLCDHDSRFYSTLLCVSRVLVFMRPDWRTTVSAAWSGRTRVIAAKTSASEIRAVIWIPASPNAVVYIQIPGPRGGSYERLLSESSSLIPDKNPEQWHQTGHGYISAENVNRSVIVTRSAFFLPFYTDEISQKYDRDQIINIFQQLYKNDDQINFKGDV